MSKKKLFSLTAMTAAGATLFESCLGAFWDGLWNTGFDYGQGEWVDLVLDVIREDLFS